jgi:hypothetical protein
MKDFSLVAYRHYLELLVQSGAQFLTFEQFIESGESSFERYVLLRHDVDRKPTNALAMAKVEAALNVSATYYFRITTIDDEIIKQILELGHEVGFHYESLSDADGNFDKAYDLFRQGLAQFEKLTDVKTISMHGRPLKPYDNRDLWKTDKGQKLLNELGILGEIYLCVDYQDIAYVNDTGRNWESNRSNRRDKVNSLVNADFVSQDELIAFFKNPHPKTVFQVHPERWSDSPLEWWAQAVKDSAINLAKIILTTLRR